jgi:hypothetical protein|tara:strand:+ start:1428 stop:1841 length:414 start_codon:yes stop_codon:yes gene_type:complete
MAVLTYDAVDIIKNLIRDEWSSIRPPMISAIWEKRSVGFVDDRKDQLIIYPKTETINYFGLGGSAFWHEQIMELEVRTYKDIKRHNEVVKKIAQIIKDNIAGTNYTDLRVLSSYSKNYLFRNMYSYVFTLSLRKADP